VVDKDIRYSRVAKRKERSLTAKEVNYENIIIAPLYYGTLRYYDGIYYRVINENLTLCNGGMYSSEGISSLGVAL
jgi:hypothetical protein